MADPSLSLSLSLSLSRARARALSLDLTWKFHLQSGMLVAARTNYDAQHTLQSSRDHGGVSLDKVPGRLAVRRRRSRRPWLARYAAGKGRWT